MCNVVQIANKLNQLFYAQAQGLKTVQSQRYTGGYAATTDGSSVQSKNKGDDLVEIEKKTEMLKFLEETMGWSVAKVIWPTLRKLPNSANKTMRELLTRIFGVREFHPMIMEFTEKVDSPTELRDRLKKSLDENDNKIFKREKRTLTIGDEEGSRRAIEDRKSWSVEQLNAAIRNRMVSNIVHAVSGDSSSEHGSVENK